MYDQRIMNVYLVVLSIHTFSHYTLQVNLTGELKKEQHGSSEFPGMLVTLTELFFHAVQVPLFYMVSHRSHWLKLCTTVFWNQNGCAIQGGDGIRATGVDTWMDNHLLRRT